MENRGSLDPLAQLVGQLSTSRKGNAHVLGVIGCRSGDGATFVARSLSTALASRTDEEVVELSPADLSACAWDTHGSILEACSKRSPSNLWRLDPPTRHGSAKQPGASGVLARVVEALSSRFGFVVLDCGAVGVSGMLWPVARVVDELLLVVGAGETTKSQIAYAQRLIERSGAPLAGCILNKRTYPLPKPIYRLLT